MDERPPLRPEEASQARVLLETVLPAGFRGCAPYGVPGYANFLIAADAVPAAHSPMRLDLRLDGDGVAAVADWRQAAPGTGLLNGMGVRSDCRGQGLARGLLRQGFEVARQSGWHELQLHVRPENLAAQALYASAGFTDTGGRSWWSLQAVDLSASTDSVVRNWATASACFERYGFGDVELVLPHGAISVRILVSGVVRAAAEDVRDPDALALVARLAGARQACLVHGESGRPSGRDIVEFQHWSLKVPAPGCRPDDLLAE